MEELKIVEVPSLHYAVVDAVASLTRLRTRLKGPFLLERPRAGLIIETVSEEKDGDHLSVVLRVACTSWEGTVLTLSMSSSDPKRTDWLAWGEFSIDYGVTHYPALSGKTVRRRIGPSFETKADWAPMRYRVRVPVSR